MGCDGKIGILILEIKSANTGNALEIFENYKDFFLSFIQIRLKGFLNLSVI